LRERGLREEFKPISSVLLFFVHSQIQVNLQNYYRENPKGNRKYRNPPSVTYDPNTTMSNTGQQDKGITLRNRHYGSRRYRDVHCGYVCPAGLICSLPSLKGIR